MPVSLEKVVRARGLEPPILAEPDPKSGVSAIPPRAQPLFTGTYDDCFEPFDNCYSMCDSVAY